MPTNDVRKSDAESEQPPTDSVFDFLYSDSARIASLLAQFDPSGYGYITGAKTTDSREESRSDKATGQVTGKIPLVSGRAGYEGSMGLRAAEVGELTYDPYWSHARNLLNLLDDRLVRDLDQARIGQIVAVTGHLAVADLAMLKSIWDAKAVQKPLRDGLTKQAATLMPGQDQPPDDKTLDDVAEAMVSLVKSLPHLIQARLQVAAGGKLWGTLKETGLVGSAQVLSRTWWSFGGGVVSGH